jgi:Uncharacterized alpha/beta hydrolase domain (DUF2235)
MDASASIRVFRQALSLGEHRITFSPRLYQPHTGDGTQTGDGVNQSDEVNMWFAGCHSGAFQVLNARASSRSETIGQDVTETPQQGDEGEGEGTSTNDDFNVLADAHDALLPIRDELIQMPLWWILEIFPESFASWW